MNAKADVILTIILKIVEMLLQVIESKKDKEDGISYTDENREKHGG